MVAYVIVSMQARNVLRFSPVSYILCFMGYMLRRFSGTQTNTLELFYFVWFQQQQVSSTNYLSELGFSFVVIKQYLIA